MAQSGHLKTVCYLSAFGAKRTCQHSRGTDETRKGRKRALGCVIFGAGGWSKNLRQLLGRGAHCIRSANVLKILRPGLKIQNANHPPLAQPAELGLSSVLHQSTEDTSQDGTERQKVGGDTFNYTAP